MSDKPLGAGWQEMGEELLAGVVEWRLQHSKATFREIEQAIDQRLNRLRSKMLQDTARIRRYVRSVGWRWWRAGSRHGICKPKEARKWPWNAAMEYAPPVARGFSPG